MNHLTDAIIQNGVSVLPGPAGITICPDLLTEAEAIRFLRLDVDGPAHPKQTLAYYRERGFLKAVKVGRRLRYPKKELLKFLDRLAEMS
jgi:hypothetical protein